MDTIPVELLIVIITKFCSSEDNNPLISETEYYALRLVNRQFDHILRKIITIPRLEVKIFVGRDKKTCLRTVFEKIHHIDPIYTSKRSEVSLPLNEHTKIISYWREREFFFHEDIVSRERNGSLQLDGEPDVFLTLLKTTSLKAFIEHGNTSVVRLLLEDPRIDPAFDNNSCMAIAVRNGCLGIVEMFLKDTRINPTSRNNYCIRVSCGKGWYNIVKLLLNDHRVDPTVMQQAPIRLAAKNGYDRVVDLLLQDTRINPAVNNNFPIREASENGHLLVVKRLLEDPRVNPADANNDAIKRAYDNCHDDIVELLQSHGCKLE